MKKNEKNQIFSYVISAYIISWLFWIIAFLLGYDDPSFINLINWQFENQQEMTAFIVFRLGIYGPLIASVAVTYNYYGRQGLKLLWKGIISWRVGIKWYLYLFLIPLCINLIVLAIGLIMGIPSASFFNSDLSLTLILFLFLYQIFTSGLEEPGWRGFLLNKLQKKYTAKKASWLLGLIWAIWHYPYVIFLYYSGGVMGTAFSLAGFTMAIIGQTFIFTFIYNNTGSILMAILLHAWLNTSATIILGDITITNPIMGIIPALVTWGVVFVLLKKYGGERLVNNS